MTTEAQILTPAGRLVQGDHFEPQTKNHVTGAQLTDKQGNPTQQYFIALAIPKNDPGWPEFWQQLQFVAQGGFPNGAYNRPDFAWKIMDGDQRPEKEGFSGHWVVRMTSGYAWPIYRLNQSTGQFEQIVNSGEVKRGDYFRAYVTVRPNGDQNRPGIYINPHSVQFLGYGEPISTGPDPNTVFGTAPPSMPQGASSTPQAGGTPPPAGPAPANNESAGPAPSPQGGAPEPPPPAPDFLQGPKMIGPYSYEQLKAVGWTDEQMVQYGYMEPQG